MKVLLGAALVVLALAVPACGAWCETIGAPVAVEGTLTYLEPTDCYVEYAGRAGGIWVQAATTGFQLGDGVLASGTYAIADGEPTLTGAVLSLQGAHTDIRPFAMKNRAIGGAARPGALGVWDYVSHRVLSGGDWTWQRDWQAIGGANNTGVLVKTWGTVNASYESPVTGAKWFYIDDGSGTVSDLGDIGVLVYSDTEVHEGDFVSVQGVSSTEPSLDTSDRLIRVVRTRGAADVQVLRTVGLP